LVPVRMTMRPAATGRSRRPHSRWRCRWPSAAASTSQWQWRIRSGRPAPPCRGGGGRPPPPHVVHDPRSGPGATDPHHRPRSPRRDPAVPHPAPVGRPTGPDVRGEEPLLGHLITSATFFNNSHMLPVEPYTVLLLFRYEAKLWVPLSEDKATNIVQCSILKLDEHPQ
jgi:hypothetical protein